MGKQNIEALIPEPPEAKVHYDTRDSSYWYKVTGRYICLKKGDIKLLLQKIGYSKNAYRSDGICQIDWPLIEAMEKRQIDYAGPLAGHRIGIFNDGSGRNFLITEEAKGVWDELPKLKKGETPEVPKFFLRFLQELLPDDQWIPLCYWLAIGLRSLRLNDFQPGQAAVFAGPAGCGKSLLQSIITQLLGGRSANPFRYMIGETQFNKDLASSEHWQIEDPASSTDIRTRRMFGDKLKEATVNGNISIHQKGKDALSLPGLRRVTISINDEPECLAVIPPMDPSIMGKIFLFKCAKVTEAFNEFRGAEGTPNLPGDEFKGEGELNRKAVWDAVTKEIPIIRAWLLRTFTTIPKELRGRPEDRAEADRFGGLAAWHHPELLAELSSLAPEVRLLNLIDHVLWGDEEPPHNKWEGKSIELEDRMRKSSFNFEVEKVLRYIGACGSYLGKLARSHPHRVSKRMKDGLSLWTIHPPSSSEEKSNGEDTAKTK